MDKITQKSKTSKVKRLSGVALRDSKDHTLLVAVTTVVTHPVYQKRYKKIRKFLVHADMEVQKGDKLVIEETRPISKNKSWKVVKEVK